jgi:pimeloyl-ACP methyl ester carboxylesterase
MRDHVLFVPGMMCDHRLFEPQILSLSHEYTTDVAKICNAETIAQMAGDILAQAPDVFALVGLSMGGIVAMEMLRRAPQRISRIALLDTNPLAETQAVSDAREPQIARVRAGGLKDVMQRYFIAGTRYGLGAWSAGVYSPVKSSATTPRSAKRTARLSGAGAGDVWCP